MRWKVLLVDDDPLTRFLISTHLTEHSSEIVEFDRAKPAFDALLAGPFDLLITDLEMPGDHDGHWLLAEARQSDRDLPIIVITGGVPEDHDLSAANTVVLKPFHPDELIGEALALMDR